MSDDANVTLLIGFRRQDSDEVVESSPYVVALAVLLVFVLSPMILCGNSLILTALYRFKRLRTPSNYLIISLASSDLGAGIFLPAGMYMELTSMHTSDNNLPSSLCVLPYCFGILVCSASIIVMAAISMDRFTSLAQPLRYNNLITHKSMERYILLFWLYSGLVAMAPLLYSQCFSRVPTTACNFLAVIDRPVQFFLFCAVYGPCAAILLGCYCYVYIVARYHARAIYTVELSLRQQDYYHTRYGQTLAITVGLFICLWTPFQVWMITDILNNSSTLSGWTAIFLAMPIFVSSAINPWVYGYRNSEVRSAVQRVLEELLGCIGFESPQYVCPELLTATVHGDHAELNSFASHVRLCAVSPIRCTSLLLPPSARTEVTELTNRDVVDEEAEDIPVDLTVILQELNTRD